MILRHCAILNTNYLILCSGVILFLMMEIQFISVYVNEIFLDKRAFSIFLNAFSFWRPTVMQEGKTSKFIRAHKRK